MTRLLMFTVLSIAVLSLAACGGGEGRGVDTKQASSSGEGGEDFSVTTLEGEQFDLSKKRGEVVALYFMAGW